ncbi:hypothetical protein BU16DRAFT_559187 [Lophium mytilinum]|uniref:Tetraspanin Tsp3 n=1 Tax=Lophium mytilinum TaxID=390894 RepID=A0A6A6QYX2_9PEZI|nr:hypothetical protein BU16DRAFT_559187 [Lophium mytilinum]
MPYTRKELVTAGSIIYLVVITALASYATSRANHLALPIPRTLSGFTAALPLVSGLLIQVSHSLTSQHLKRQKSLISKSPPPPYIVIVNTVVLIYSSVLISLLGTHVAPASDLLCGLETRWKALRSAKNGHVIKEIQDALQCCGLMNTHDRAWPFPDKRHGIDACEVRYERTVGCIGPWKNEEQRLAGLLIGAVGFVVVWQLLIIVNPSLHRPSWLHRVLPRRLQITNGDEEQQNTADPRRAIDFLPASERYSDNPIIEASESGDGETAEVPQRSIEGQIAELFPNSTPNGGEQEHGGHIENEWASS